MVYSVPSPPMSYVALTSALRRRRPLVGLASAVVPAAVLVHLVSEGLALGWAGLNGDFVARHVYLVLLAALATWAFAASVGLGRGRAEIRRRTGLLRAALAPRRRPAALGLLLVANLAFFTLTQADEGLPILSGTLWLALAAATLGSILSALLVYAFGRTFLTVAVAALDWRPRRARSALPSRVRPDAAHPRNPSTSYSLFVPTRPPPADPFISSISKRFEGIHLCSAWFARRIWRRCSFLELRFS